MFFSASTSRLNTLSEKLDNISNAQILRKLCPINWSLWHSECKSIKSGYVRVLSALEILVISLNQSNAVKHKEKSICNKIKS